jgi:hypothetical protein
MAISAGDLASATDPFLLAFDVAYSSTTMEWTYYRIKIFDSEGLLNGITDKDVQDIFWQNDTDADKSFPAAAMQTGGSGSFSPDHEFGAFEQDVGGGTFETFSARNAVQADPKTAYVFLAGRANGAVVYSLYAYIALTWYDRDPAQILFSWIAHHMDNSVLTMKDYIDQTSFAAASAYYDLNLIGLTVWREVGQSIADQTVALFEHTADFLVIAPDTATGAVKLKIATRGAMTERTTPINLAGDSVASYTIRPTDRFRVDRLDARFGSLTMIANSITADSAADYLTGFPIDFPHISRNMASQKVGPVTAANKIELSLPYHQTRDRLLNHVDIGYWKDGQDEIEIEFADWTHFNFEAGDVVPVLGESYVGTERFLVVEKHLDLDTLLATARLLQIHVGAGTSPKLADAANMIFSLRPNSLGNHVDGTTVFPLRIGYSASPRVLDRWIDESGRFAHATQMDRGTGGPAGANPTPPHLTLDAIGRWPAIVFDGTSAFKQGTVSASKLSGPYTTAAVDFTFYAVVRVDDTAAALDTIWAYSNAGTIMTFDIASGVPRYNDGGGSIGSGSALSGWQIIVWTLKAAASSTIRRNGVQIHSGGAYTQRQLVSVGASYSIGCNAAGTLYLFSGAIAELTLFQGAHSVARTQAIELYLSGKYGIAI